MTEKGELESMNKRNRKSLKIRTAIMAAALSVSMIFALTAASTTAAASTSASGTTAVTDGTYTGKITAISDTSVTIAVFGGKGGHDKGKGGPGGQKGSDAKSGTDSTSGTQDSSKPSGQPPQGDNGGAADATAESGAAGTAQAPKHQEMTFTVTADQISGFAKDDRVTIVVKSGAVTSIKKDENKGGPSDKKDAGAATSTAESSTSSSN